MLVALSLKNYLVEMTTTSSSLVPRPEEEEEEKGSPPPPPPLRAWERGLTSSYCSFRVHWNRELSIS